MRTNEDADYATLSGGQKQRLAIALALINDPQMLFLDEPTSGLDPQVRLEIRDLIEELRAEKRTILMTTHYIEEAERLCDRVAIIDAGQIIAIGSPRELQEKSANQSAIEIALTQPWRGGELAGLAARDSQHAERRSAADQGHLGASGPHAGGNGEMDRQPGNRSGRRAPEPADARRCFHRADRQETARVGNDARTQFAVVAKRERCSNGALSPFWTWHAQTPRRSEAGTAIGVVATPRIAAFGCATNELMKAFLALLESI